MFNTLPPFICPDCWAVSHNPRDRVDGWCSSCQDWTAPPRAVPGLRIIQPPFDWAARGE